MRRAEEDPSEKRSTENTGMENQRIADTEILTEIQGERRKSGENERGVNTEIQRGTETRISNGKMSGRIDTKREGESGRKRDMGMEMKMKKDIIEMIRKMVKDGGIERKTGMWTCTIRRTRKEKEIEGGLRELEGKRKEEKEKKRRGKETKKENEREEKDTEQEKVTGIDLNMMKSREKEKGERDTATKNTLGTKKENTEGIEKIKRGGEEIKKVIWQKQVTLEKLNTIGRS